METVFIPLLPCGPNLIFESRVPTDWELSNLPIVQLTASTWSPADLHMSRPLSALTTSVVDCISPASRDIWSDSTNSCVQYHPPLTVALSFLSILMLFSCPMRLRGHMVRVIYAQRSRASDIRALASRTSVGSGKSDLKRRNAPYRLQRNAEYERQCTLCTDDTVSTTYT